MDYYLDSTIINRAYYWLVAPLQEYTSILFSVSFYSLVVLHNPIPWGMFDKTRIETRRRTIHVYLECLTETRLSGPGLRIRQLEWNGLTKLDPDVRAMFALLTSRLNNTNGIQMPSISN